MVKVSSIVSKKIFGGAKDGETRSAYQKSNSTHLAFHPSSPEIESLLLSVFVELL
jgi:ABC-type cobalt transport system substrate-binding protein